MTSEISSPRGGLETNPTMPWLSVVIPSHGDAHWLVFALDSLVAQTRTGFECILVDSSPNDDIAILAERYRDRLPLRVERRPDLVGWQRKTIHGVGLARANHVSMLHPDDLWEPLRADAVKRWLTERPNDVMHLHPSWIVDERGDRLGLLRCPFPPDTDLSRQFVLERLIVQNFISVCAPVIRRDAFLRAGIDPNLWYSGDWDFYLKLAALGSVRYHAEPLACYRIHGGAMTITGSRDAESFRAQLRAVLDAHIDEIDASRRPIILSRARASMALNVALAAALHGRRAALVVAFWSMLRLGPFGLGPFLRDTRLLERVLPRLRSRISLRSALA